jgi:hypothetical protein
VRLPWDGMHCGNRIAHKGTQDYVYKEVCNISRGLGWLRSVSYRQVKDSHQTYRRGDLAMPSTETGVIIRFHGYFGALISDLSMLFCKRTQHMLKSGVIGHCIIGYTSTGL